MRPDMRHCQECQVCVEGYDHHCGVTGVCFGDANVKYFVMMLGWGGASMMFNGWAHVAFLMAVSGSKDK